MNFGDMKEDTYLLTVPFSMTMMKFDVKLIEL